MNELKKTVAKNIAELRVAFGLTQAELGEKINYSDKAVSKWERGESVPDVFVLNRMAEIFGVTVDYLIKEHTEKPEKKCNKRKYRTITELSVLGVFTLALFVFIVLWMFRITEPLVFLYAVPAAMIVLIVENSVWGKGFYNFFYISGLVWSVLAIIYFVCFSLNWWMIFLLGIPAEFIIFLCFNLCKKKS